MLQLTPSTVRALLARHGVRPSRALGQNFLVDPNTAQRIVRLAEVGPGDRVLEIGPGIGSLTVALVRSGASVLALEVDRHVLPILEQVLDGAGPGSVHVVSGDALTADLDELLDRASGETWTCVSNLPYNVAVPVIVRLLEQCPQVQRALVMVQKEVGERLVAAPGSRVYGAVSVKVAYYARARIVGHVSASVFLPRPNVESALVRVDRRAEPAVEVPVVDDLFELVRAGFAQRRKTLRRSLAPVLGARTEAVLHAAGIEPSARAESLGLEQWARVAREAA